MNTTIFFDTKSRGYYRPDGTAATFQEILGHCDRSNICLVAGTFGDDKEFSPIDLSGYSVELGLGRKDACPQKGSWSVSIAGDTTAPLSANITGKALEGYLNELPSVIAAGGLTVKVSDCNTGPALAQTSCQCSTTGEQDKGPLCWDICWNTAGDQPDIVVDTTCLWPPTVATVNTAREGDATCTEIAQIKIREQVIAYTPAVEWVPKTPSVITVTEVQAGGAGKNEIQRVTISPAPVGGSFCLEIAGCTTASISVFASSDEFEDALECADDYAVTKSGEFSWDITYLADTAAHAEAVVTCDSIRSSLGVEAPFRLDTEPIIALLNGCECVEGDLELKITDNITGSICRYTEPFRACRGMIDLSNPGAPIATPAAPGSLTGAEIKALYEAELDTNAYTDTEKAAVATIGDKADLIGGKLDPTQLPDTARIEYKGVVADETAMLTLLPAVVQIGDYIKRTDTDTYWKLNGDDPSVLSNWVNLGGAASLTGAEIKALYEAELDTNAYTDTEKAAVATIGDKADLIGGKLDPTQLPDTARIEYKGVVADETAMLALLPTVVQIGDYIKRTDTDTYWKLNGDDPSVLGNWVDLGDTASLTGAEIKALYEAELDTNAYTDAEKTKLTGIEPLADVTDPENVKAAFTGAGGYFTSSSLTSAAAITYDVVTNGIAPTLTLAHDATLGAPSSMVDGQTVSIAAVMDGVGNRNLVFGAAYKNMGSIPSTDVATFTANTAFEISIKRVGTTYRYWISKELI